jgi:hypothetical protein
MCLNKLYSHEHIHTSYVHDSVQGPGRSQIHFDGASQYTSGTQYNIWQQHCILKHSASQTSGASYEKTTHIQPEVTNSWVGK